MHGPPLGPPTNQKKRKVKKERSTYALERAFREEPVRELTNHPDSSKFHPQINFHECLCFPLWHSAPTALHHNSAQVREVALVSSSGVSMHLLKLVHAFFLVLMCCTSAPQQHVGPGGSPAWLDHPARPQPAGLLTPLLHHAGGEGCMQCEGMLHRLYQANQCPRGCA
eukprot:1148011-Pelagomonas_calceolata.AAC.12